ncbi:MAG: flagellar hook-associated protein FlgL [Betaproteobacteria bacterium]|nr:flagellar hook-associated protein FlgL [Betaproteobacteria bacterium]
MRISTGMIFDSGVKAMQNRTSSLLHNQQQIASGRRILTPADDPVAAARALEVDHAKGMNDQYGLSLGNAKDALGMVDSKLSSAGDLLVRIRELAVQAGDAGLSVSDRHAISSELRSRYDELIALGNSTDGTGQYLFSGYQGSTMPFSGSVANGVAYRGDDGQRALRVSSSREMPVSDSGNDIFMNIKNGNGVFATGAQSLHSANPAKATLDSWTSTLTPPALPSSTGNLDVRFWINPAATAGSATGTVTYPPGFTVTGVNDNQFSISVDGAAATIVTVPSIALNAGNIVATLNGVLPAGATASLNAANQVVVTSAATGSTSAITLGAVSGNTGLANILGAPASVAGANAGSTFYDLVNPATGNSLFTGSSSNTGTVAGQAGFTGHLYTSGASINLSGTPPLSLAFDYGASIVISGAPQLGDIFSLNRSNTALTVTAAPVTATINAGAVTDPVKWSNAANSGNLEARFWVNPAAAAGFAAGSATFPPGYTVAAGSNDQFSISVNGAAATTVTLPPGALTAGNVVSTLNGAGVLPAGATASLNAAGQVVVTSTTAGSTSAISLKAVAGNTGLASLFGSPVSVAGAAAGATSYDLVDAANGKSLFTGATSTPGGAGFVGHPYSSGTPIVLAGTNPPYAQAFDFGANVTVSGTPGSNDVFTIKNGVAPGGNGYFLTSPKTVAAVNNGSGIVGVGEVRDAAKWNSASNSGKLEVRFWKDAKANPPVLYYDLVDKVTEKSLFTNTATNTNSGANTYTHKFVSGDAINFSGLAAPYNDFGAAVTISGTPASGDVFALNNSSSESIFDTLGRLINALETPVGTGSNGNTALHNTLGSVINNLGQATDNILRVRADIGTRLGEVDTLNSVTQDMNLQYSDTLSRLQDVDYAQAITDLTRQQTELQAAQQSFSKIAQLSLFNYV